MNTTPLPKLIKKNKFEYRLIKRSNKNAIYSQWLHLKKNEPPIKVGHEVFIIRIQKEAILPNGNIIEQREKFPANNDFGRYAWSIPNETKAIKAFNDLENNIKPFVDECVNIPKTKKQPKTSNTKIIKYKNYVIRLFKNDTVMAHIDGKPKGPKTPIYETLIGLKGYKADELKDKTTKELKKLLFS